MVKIDIILVLEKNRLFESTESDLSAQEDFIVKSVVGVDAAVELIRKGGCDAVLSGMTLESDQDGLEFLQAVRKLDPLLPFFFYTGEDSPQTIATAFQSGAHDYFVAKDSPYQVEEIVEAIRVNVELAKLLRTQQGGPIRSSFEEKYAGLFEELEEGSMMVSAETGVITFASDSLAASLGYSVDKVIGKSLDELLVSRGDSPISFHDLVDCAEKGTGVVETSFRHGSGTVCSFWSQLRLLELGGSKVMLCQFRDVTQFEQMEREVISVRNQLRTIVENSADAIIVANEKGAVEFFGGAGPQLFGLTPEEGMSKNIGDLFADRSHEVKRMMQHLGNRPRISGLESSVESRWGTRVPVSVAITVLPSSDGVFRYLFNILDITAQKMGEAEKMLSAELIRMVSTDAGPVESLPKLIERIRGTVPIDHGLVLGLEEERETLTVVALYTAASASKLRVGQTLEIDYLPAEEELWRRDGIIRNNLKEDDLPPLEKMLFEEGIRSFVSVPLMEGRRLVGSAFFGSFRGYAINRGHLSLFRDLAGVLSGALMRAQSTGDAQRFRFFTAALAAEIGDPILLCDQEGVVLEANASALELLGAEAELRGRPIARVLRPRFRSLVPDVAWLRKSSGTQRPYTSKEGERWMIFVSHVGSGGTPAGYSIRLQKA